MLEDVKRYYGETLTGSEDLKTNACCTPTGLPPELKAILSEIHEAVATRYYGCGLVIPPQLEDTRVLDLGCGAGRDCYLLSRLVGENGEVVGVDMTEAQLAVARAHLDYHTERFGYRHANVRFVQGYIEQLDQLGLGEDQFDVIVSNCVLNLSQDKHAVLAQVHRLLKPGGEFYFSDVYADRRVPTELTQNPVLYSECLSGALYWNDFLELAGNAGFADPRLVENRPLTISEPEILAQLGGIQFCSATYRLFKIPGLETTREDYGQSVRYRGGVTHVPDRFRLDADHVFDEGRIDPVCGNTFRMLKESRFEPYFDFFGDRRTHLGAFGIDNRRNPFGATVDSSAQNCC